MGNCCSELIDVQKGELPAAKSEKQEFETNFETTSTKYITNRNYCLVFYNAIYIFEIF